MLGIEKPLILPICGGKAWMMELVCASRTPLVASYAKCPEQTTWRLAP
jgi:hypothetical protein